MRILAILPRLYALPPASDHRFPVGPPEPPHDRDLPIGSSASLERIAVTFLVDSVVEAVEQGCEGGGTFVAGPFPVARGLKVIMRRPDGTVVEYLQPENPPAREDSIPLGAASGRRPSLRLVERSL